ncbi:amidohydrolase [Pseudoalteromonas byunsanensis]|uniref:Omega-amidase YafV n=1 Tax=Pseudoalteromonas byunsanensis TaxID=327939 RepID=A0A1S1N817_9GAMM|nr:amidohydrolase [Pseudoalteromonas byunsanensis]OHU97510.1 nitrilase family protein [Pseudoalteromonas byunsanensis]
MSVIASSLKVALVQSDIHWCQVAQNLINLDSMLALNESVDLLVLPETFATGFAIDLDVAEPEEGPIFTWMKCTAARLNTVVAGSVLVQQANKKANRFYWVWPDGHYEFYDKRHLFCLGNEGAHVVAGQQRKVFTVKGFRVLPQVCYDLRFPVFQRSQNDYDVMINVANWPAVRRYAWDHLLIARAIENQCYVLACNRIGDDGNGVAHSGGTVAYDYLGQPISRVNDEQQGVCVLTLLYDELVQFRARFPAHLDADAFTLNT